MMNFYAHNIHPAGDDKKTVYNLGLGFVRKMRVTPSIIASEHMMLDYVDELQRHQFYGSHELAGQKSVLKQLAGVCTLPGVVKVVGFPDLHIGKTFPVGCLAVVDVADENAVVCNGGIGPDINCGVRFMISDLQYGFHIPTTESDDFCEKMRKMAEMISPAVGRGVGPGNTPVLKEKQFIELLQGGMAATSKLGWNRTQDPRFCEDMGSVDIADASLLNAEVKDIGNRSLGTLGAGNHYVEMCRVTEICEKDIAAKFGIINVGQIGLAVHTGSRGLGKQIVDTYDPISKFEMKTNHIQVAEDLPCLPFKSNNAKAYLRAAAAASNFAYANRTLIVHKFLGRLNQYLGMGYASTNFKMVTDVSHNVFKLETHTDENGISKEYLIHRKGASRSLPPYHRLLPTEYHDLGQPIFVGGSMATSSYLITGTENITETYNTTLHGSGRKIKRSSAGTDDVRLTSDIERKDNRTSKSAAARSRLLNKVYIDGSDRSFIDEAPECYKDIDEAVSYCVEMGINRKICKLEPIFVIKG